MDTPGHVDFSAEMERTLQILDYAVLIIGGTDGVQGHVETLWRLLRQYKIPVFLFINKMDQDGANSAEILKELQSRLDEKCIDFTASQPQEEFMENLAMCDETVLETYLEEGEISKEQVKELIARRKAFPCYFGSALKSQGIQEFLEGLETYTKVPDYPDTFGAKVYKISRDEKGSRLTHMKILKSQGIQEFLEGLETYTKVPDYPDTFGAKVYKISRDEKGSRLTHMKITGGSLKVKQVLSGEDWEEKADQIRIYSGHPYEDYRGKPESETGAVRGGLGRKG